MEKKEKVLIVHNYYQIPGGEDTVVANEKKLLEEHGHEVVFYSRDNSELKHFSTWQKLMIPITTVFNPKTYKEVKRIIRENNIDIVHVHNTLNLISPSVYYAAFSCKVPVVQTIHNFRLVCPGATFFCGGHICEECLEKDIGCAIRHKCYRNSTMQTAACVVTTWIHKMLGVYRKINYICLTEFTKEKICSITDPRRVYIKPNFVYDQRGENDAEDYYIFVGRIEEIKGINLLVDAFHKMPDKKLKIVGTGNLYEHIAKRIAEEGISNIEMLGYKHHEGVNSLLKKAKALIMCSQWYETFGMVIAEAYSNAVPVIVGRIGNIQDLVQESVTGELFRYDSPDDLKAAVLRFEMGNQKEYSRQAYLYYQNSLTDEINYDMLISIYNKVKV